ncbi:hypothetical protein E6R60_27000 [Streptomyces sp. A0642]|uniref:hypothetical protein n=1 Tax=Streptomyces sp. A0642 TaxID=2563100 RepID=UPI0010A25F1D|nr:hypothetical protein [Streptomyces sp. A0642]THA72580.1 hypothetical protein E6R60_27000 [Streptomyces sp. A0642]
MSDTYGTYDPADRPGRKATAPEAVSTLTAEDGTVLPSFDQRHSENFRGLLYIGSLTERFSWLGHDFVIRTLAVDELLAVSLVLKEYQGTGGGEQLAYATAMVSMSVVSVDGEELPAPIGEDQKLAEWAHRRFAYVKNNWYQYTISHVFQKYLELEDKAQQVVDAMGKAFASTD